MGHALATTQHGREREGGEPARVLRSMDKVRLDTPCSLEKHVAKWEQSKATGRQAHTVRPDPAAACPCCQEHADSEIATTPPRHALAFPGQERANGSPGIASNRQPGCVTVQAHTVGAKSGFDGAFGRC